MHLQSLKAPKRTVTAAAAPGVAVQKVPEEDAKTEATKPTDEAKSANEVNEVNSNGFPQDRDSVANEAGKPPDESKNDADHSSKPAFEVRESFAP